MQQKPRRNTKIVCTLGPATDSAAGIAALLEAGMDVVRLNFSHGDRETTAPPFTAFARPPGRADGRSASCRTSADPRFGSANFRRRGSPSLPEPRLISGSKAGTRADVLPVSYPHLIEDVGIGERILLADGMVELEVKGAGSIGWSASSSTAAP